MCKSAAFMSVSLLNMLYEQRINIFSFWRAAARWRPHSRWQAVLKCAESRTSCRRSTWQQRNHCVPSNPWARFLKHPLECFSQLELNNDSFKVRKHHREASLSVSLCKADLYTRGALSWKRFDFRLTGVKAGNESEHLFNTMKTTYSLPVRAILCWSGCKKNDYQ